MKETLFYEKKDNEKVKCTLCPHNCTLDEGKTGFCGVRKNINGRLYSLTYGLVSSTASDPIEKKPLYHFYPGTKAYSLGGLGCNVACQHCQNHHISQEKKMSSIESMKSLPPEEIVSQAIKNNCKTIAWTYNEPTIWYEYIKETSMYARDKGLKTALITNGVINQTPLKDLLPFIDAYRVDIKGFSNDFYKEIAGFPFLNYALASAELAYAENCHLEIVTNIIPGKNDDEEQLRGISEWIAKKLSPMVPWHLTAYYPANKLSIPSTSLETLKKALEIGKESGLKNIYLGNIHSFDYSITNCPDCGTKLIEREGYVLSKNIIKHGKCPNCSHEMEMYID